MTPSIKKFSPSLGPGAGAGSILGPNTAPGAAKTPLGPARPAAKLAAEQAVKRRPLPTEPVSKGWGALPSLSPGNTSLMSGVRSPPPLANINTPDTLRQGQNIINQASPIAPTPPMMRQGQMAQPPVQPPPAMMMGGLGLGPPPPMNPMGQQSPFGPAAPNPMQNLATMGQNTDLFSQRPRPLSFNPFNRGGF
jgi:hypothetical protein